MKKFFLSFILLFALCYITFAQTAQVDSNNSITKIEDNSYQVNVTVTAKKATTLLVETIKSREDTEITIGTHKIAVQYIDRKYVVSFDGKEHAEQFTKISDARKVVLSNLRETLGII